MALDHVMLIRLLYLLKSNKKSSPNLFSLNLALYYAEGSRSKDDLDKFIKVTVGKMPEEKLAKKVQADQYNLVLTKLIENNIDNYLAAECKKTKMHHITEVLSNMILESFNKKKECLSNDKINFQEPKCRVYQALYEGNFL